MPETTKTCQVEMRNGKPCGRDLYDDEHCIFHSEEGDKDLDSFQKGINRILSMPSELHDFTRFIFPEGVAFPKKFLKPTIFRRATFTSEADFGGAIFAGRVDFRDVRFLNRTNFRRSVFEREANFRRASFKHKALFISGTFKAKTQFDRAHFLDETTFAGTMFYDGIDFCWAMFDLGAVFSQAVFKGSAIFDYFISDGEINFKSCVFQDAFSMKSYDQHFIELVERDLIKSVDFTSVKFSKPEKVKFQKIDLSKFRFLETDLRGVHFIDEKWDERKTRKRVYDEISPKLLFGESDYPLIAQLYRRLRANYEENLRYGEAGDFYIGEMEMTRKAQSSIFKKLPLLFYKAISNYGESYYRPLGWIAAILLIFPLLFMFAGIQPVTLDPSNPIQDVIHYRLDFSSIKSFLPISEKIGDYYTSFLYSMSVFSFILDKKYTTINNWGHTLFVLESILSPVTLAFFLLALRRRFKR